MKTIKYTIKKVGKSKGKIKSVSLTYGQSGYSFYYDSKAKKWRKGKAQVSDYQKIKMPKKQKSKTISLSSKRYKYYVTRSGNSSTGASIEVVYQPKGSKKSKSKIIEANII